MSPTVGSRYELNPDNYERARRAGLVDAPWRVSPIDPETLPSLARRGNRRAALDTALWLGPMMAAAAVAVLTWWSPLSLGAIIVYGALAGGASDARWHECGHGTAFRSPGANRAVFYLASFLLLRPPTLSRWTHARHHSDTVVVGRDPEILLTRPPSLLTLALNVFNLETAMVALPLLGRHAMGRFNFEELDLVPASEVRRMTSEARAFLVILAGSVALSLLTGSPLPVILIALPSFLGAWLKVLFSTTQHGGLPENETDFRVIARTMRLNPLGRFLYLNMNYHIEHHMFPVVPYHALPVLRAAIEEDLPPAKGLIATYRELLPALWRQRTDPSHAIIQTLPSPRDVDGSEPESYEPLETEVDGDGTWLRVCDDRELGPSQVRRLDVGAQTFVVLRAESGDLMALDGICSHNRTVHLAGGAVVGCDIECPKHNGRFGPDGTVTKAPPTVPLRSYPVRTRQGRIWVCATETPEER